MKHCILVKWNEQVRDKKSILPTIRSIFDKLLVFENVYKVRLHENIINRANRFDLMICIEMDKDFLPIYDESEPHHEWKEKFGKFVGNKVVFDYEE